MSNIIHILESFKVNTEAQATNQGFYYQYLVTLDVWLKNYNKKSNVAIYCETEDDIKVENLQNNNVEFTQVKAYSKNFNIKSDEVQKSIVNFFQLYIEYKDKSPSFVFHTNTDYEGDFFNEIKMNSYKNKVIFEIEKVLVKKFEEKKNKKLIKLDKNIDEAENYISKNPNPKSNQQNKYNTLQTQLKNSTREKKNLEDDFNNLKTFVNQKAPDFIEKIEWEAEKKDKDTSINKFIKSIEKEIAQIDGFKLDTSSAYAHLINKVLYASQALNIEDRRLDSNMIDGLVKEAKITDKFKEGLQEARLLPKFQEICDYHNIQITILKRIESKIDKTVDTSSEILRLTKENKFEEKVNDAIKSIKEDIEEVVNLDDKNRLYKKLDKTEDYFKNRLDFLERILRNVDCLVEKNSSDSYRTLYKFLSFIVLSKVLSQFFIFPSANSMEIICDEYRLWLFNTFKKDKKLETHIGQIANFFKRENEVKAKVCFISSLKDKGGLNCDTCKDGVLVGVEKKVNKIVTDYSNSNSFGILGGSNSDFTDLKKKSKIEEFKCGECISNIEEYKNAYKIMKKS
jgi:hypothetical protein